MFKYFDIILKSIYTSIRFPRIKGNYYYVCKNKIFVAPSLRQIKFFSDYHYNKWSHASFIIKKTLQLNNKANVVILDIGGNVGYTALMYSQLLRKYRGKCFSFEPALININAFIHNLNHCDNVHLFKFGLGSKFENLTLGMPKYVKSSGKDLKNTGYLSASPFVKLDNNSIFYKSKSYALDGIANKITKKKKIVFMKIDAEGYETQIIKGAIQQIKKHVPVIQVEFSVCTIALKEFKKIFTILYALGYASFSKKPFSKRESDDIFFVNKSNSKLIEILNKCSEFNSFVYK